MRKLLTVTIKYFPNSQSIRFYPRWTTRQPFRIIPPEVVKNVKENKVVVDNNLSADSTKIKWKHAVAEQSVSSISSQCDDMEIGINRRSKTKVKRTKEITDTENDEETSIYEHLKYKAKYSTQYTSTDKEVEKRPDKHFEHKVKNTTEEAEHKTLKFRLKANVKPLIIRKKTTETTDMLETVIDSEGNFIYTKLKDNDSRIRSVLMDVKSKKEKIKKGLMLLEGKRLIIEALKAHCNLDYLLFSRKDDIDYLKSYLPKLGAKLYKMPYREMQMWSDLTTNPGIMGIFKIPRVEEFVPVHSLPITVICDNVREPNNLGAILRTCSGVGCEQIILTKGCTYEWDTKVLRSAAGAHFTLRIQSDCTWDHIKELLPTESLAFLADNKVLSVSNDHHINPNDETEFSQIMQSIPLLPYYEVNFEQNQHVVIVIGGETEGLSKDSYEFAMQFKGVRLNVPLSNGVDSLNTGTALAVIAFEIKRQMLMFARK